VSANGPYDPRLAACLEEPLRAGLRPFVARVPAFAFLVDAFFAVLVRGLDDRREEREVAFFPVEGFLAALFRGLMVDAFFLDAFFAVLLPGVLPLGFVEEVERPPLGRRDVRERALDRFRISPTTEPTMPAPATASIGFSLTAAAAFFVPLTLDDAALPTTFPPRETTSVPPRAARCIRPPTA
jgi:hypothetical protein